MWLTSVNLTLGKLLLIVSQLVNNLLTKVDSGQCMGFRLVQLLNCGAQHKKRQDYKVSVLFILFLLLPKQPCTRDQKLEPVLINTVLNTHIGGPSFSAGHGRLCIHTVFHYWENN